MYRKILFLLGLAVSIFAWSVNPSFAQTANCQTDADCSSSEYCYQPPMPECPSGMACIQVMPPKQCAEKTGLNPSPAPEGCHYQQVQCFQAPCDPILVCPSPNPSISPSPSPDIIPGCQTDNDCQPSEYCYQPPMPECPSGMACAQVMPAKLCQNKDDQQIKGSVISQSLDAVWPPQSLPTYGTDILNVGRVPFSLWLEFPATATIKDGGIVEYFSQLDEKTIQVRLIVYKSASANIISNVSTRDSSSLNSVPLALTSVNEKTIMIRPTTGTLFNVGYYYSLVSELVQTEPSALVLNFNAHFAAISPSGKAADLNNDNKVNLADFTILAAEFMKAGDSHQADINNDGKVNLSDYTLLSQEFGN